MSLTILWVDATIDLARWNQKYGHWVSIEVPIVGTAISIQESFGLTHCAQVAFLDVEGEEVTAFLDCVVYDDAESKYSKGDMIEIRYNPSDPEEVESEIVISNVKSKLSSTIIFGALASFFLGVLFAFHVKRYFILMQDEETVQAREDDTAKTVDSLELASDTSDSDSQDGRKEYMVRWHM